MQRGHRAVAHLTPDEPDDSAQSSGSLCTPISGSLLSTCWFVVEVFIAAPATSADAQRTLEVTLRPDEDSAKEPLFHLWLRKVSLLSLYART
jgi:hypothetical protein